MRKFTLLFTMLALSMGFSMARADVVSPYTYNFEGLSTSRPILRQQVGVM